MHDLNILSASRRCDSSLHLESADLMCAAVSSSLHEPRATSLKNNAAESRSLKSSTTISSITLRQSRSRLSSAASNLLISESTERLKRFFFM